MEKNTEHTDAVDKINEENTAGDAAAPTFKEKLDNYLYHYKWHTIIGVACVRVLIWVAFSFISGSETDASIGYIGDHGYSSIENGEISDKLGEILHFDSNGDGKTVIDFNSLYYLNYDQLKSEMEKAQGKGDEYYFSFVENAKNYEAFEKDIGSRDAAIWFVSEEVYNTLDKSKLMPLSDILGYVPEGAVDGYAIPSSSLDITNDALTPIKYRSYLVMRIEREYSTIMGNDKILEQLKSDMALFKEIVEYKK